ncbi:hypothetical protein [Sphingomonas oryzagri]|uniref:DUF4148 domain-containing protein n=1 Tax=Sphingomonas oryzagri TaxID=3042314 RepID=A0ABT6N1E2_9SPHN|nr:hypothetical protein [Sphingomonas oryzagri]MDH7638584.1 hypothetical protein [Sphingomonas oryzagri]
MTNLLVMITAAMSVAAGRADPPGATYQPDTYRPAANADFRDYKKQMIALRSQAQKLQAADGGTLTPEHDQFIQQKIDVIEGRFHRAVQGE